MGVGAGGTWGWLIVQTECSDKRHVWQEVVVDKLLMNTAIVLGLLHCVVHSLKCVGNVRGKIYFSTWGTELCSGKV